jgi:Na+/H+-dicarboxylate symporter
MREASTKVSHRYHMPSLTTSSLIGLVAGLGLGALAFRLQSGPLLGAVPILQPIGGLWINALRMTVIPLVVSQLYVTITADRPGLGVGRLGVRACAILLLLLAAAAGFTALVGPAIVSRLSFSPATLEHFRQVAAGASDLARQAQTGSPGAADWLLGLVPSNVFEAAAAGKMLPLILFIVIFALAARQVPADRRAALDGVFQAISDATFVLIRWILVLTPLGAFVLTYEMAAGSGLGAARALVTFILIVSGLLLAFTLVFYVLAVVVARVPLRRFARAVLPAQIVGLSTRSSLASLPALMEGAEDELGMSSSVSGFALPLAVSTFRVNMMVSTLFTALFLGRLYGIPIGPMGILTFVLILVPVTVAVPGIPSHLGLTSLPAYMALGIPIEGVVIIRAIDTIPDIFKTLVNVTGDMTAAVLLARFSGEPLGDAAEAGRETGVAGDQRPVVQETSRVAIS